MKLQRFCRLLAVKVRLNLRAEVANSYLNYAWWVLEPSMQMAVYYVVFGILLQQRSGDFVTFLLCGVVPMLWFTRTVSNASLSILQGKALINQVAIPKAFFPLLVVFQDLAKNAVVFALFLLFLVIYGSDIHLTWLWLLPIFLVQLALVCSMAMLVAFCIPFARDLQYVVNTGLTLLTFASGVFYSYEELLLPEHRQLFLLNPMANLIASYRMALLDGVTPRIVDLAAIGAGSILLVALLVSLTRSLDPILTRKVLE